MHAVAVAVVVVLSVAPQSVFAQPRATVSAGVPKLDTNDLHLEADAGLGYAWPAVTVWAEGGGRIFNVEQTGREQTETDVRLDAEAAYLHSFDAALRVQLGVAAGFAQYTTDSTFFTPFSSSDEVSQMSRWSGTAGLAWQASKSLATRAVVLGGWQREAYLRTAVDGTGALEDVDTRAATFRYATTVHLEWTASPELLAVALRSGLEGFGITRSQALFSYSPGLGLSQQATVAAAQRLDGRARLEATVLAAQWLTLAPFLYGEVRYVRTAAVGSAIALYVPSAGIGIRTPLL